MNEEARPATEADLRRIAELVAAGIAELEPMKGGSVWVAREAPVQPYDRRLALALTDDDTQLLAGTLDGVVVGYALTRVEHLGDGSHLGVIDEIFVEDGARGVGVGEAMMRSVLKWMTEHRCFGVDSMALPGHRLTKNFFEESGFTARKIVMHHRMEQP